MTRLIKETEGMGRRLYGISMPRWLALDEDDQITVLVGECHLLAMYPSVRSN